MVLEAPADVFAFHFNPAQPQWVAAGCLGGQVALWNLEQLAAQREQAARLLPEPGSGAGAAGSRRNTTDPSQGAASGAAAGEGGAELAAFLRPNVLQPAFVSLLDASHQAAITDLRWLPGLAAMRDGRLEPAAEPTECMLFATTAMDGRVLIWDMRINAGRRRMRATTGGGAWDV